ncbi:MAG: HNH endonuclease [Planctomycetes bacterium]|nr:HNH endonuclease [Planctomycetota bacterium]
MPDREVETMRDLLYYQYAKLIARRAFGQPDGVAAKSKHYGFIKKTFRELRDGQIKWSDIVREDWQLVEAERRCAYCGASNDLAREHIVPSSLRVNERCATCDTIQGIHNQVWACRACNSRKGTMGLYAFYRTLFPADRKFYDRIPPLVEKKYLKTVHDCLACLGCHDAGDVDRDGELTVLDIDFALGRFT